MYHQLLIYLYDPVKKNWYSFEDFKRKYTNTSLSYLEYFSIISAIPKLWQKICQKGLHTQDSNKIKHIQVIKKTNKKAKWYYSHNLQNRGDKNWTAIRAKWEKLLKWEISEKNWSQQMCNIKASTLSTKLQAFQYRLINFALVTNIQLHKWNILPSDLCTFCKKDQETIIHLFTKCEHVKKKIWYPLSRWLYNFCLIQLDVNQEFELLFNAYKDSFPQIVNLIILIAKHYVYVKRCLLAPLSFTELIANIAHHRTIEEVISKRTNTHSKFKAKWSIYNRI